MSRIAAFRKEYRDKLARVTADYGSELESVNLDLWRIVTSSPTNEKIIAVWMSRKFLVQVYDESSKQPDLIRLSITKNEIGKQRTFADGIGWDELQSIKDGCGYSDRMGVEIYPEHPNIINVVNMRHLWVLPTRLDFAWVGKKNAEV